MQKKYILCQKIILDAKVETLCVARMKKINRRYTLALPVGLTVNYCGTPKQRSKRSLEYLLKFQLKILLRILAIITLVS